MSDPQGPATGPTEEPIQDVVGRANEGLAEAEAAGAHATRQDIAAERGQTGGIPVEEAAAPAAEAAAEEPVFATPGLNAAYAESGYADGQPTVATTPVDPVATDYAPTATPPASVLDEYPAQQPVFVQAPEEPRPRGNRAMAGVIGLIAAVCFAFLYLDAGVAIGFVNGSLTADGLTDWLVSELTSWGLWVPTVVFFVAFWLLGAIINRGRWGVWVIFGLLVGVAAWAGHLLGQLFEAPFWMVSVDEGTTIVKDQLFAPLAIAAFVIGRELTVWFGAWAAARGRRVTERNVEARREYERTLEAGPQLPR